MWILSAVAMGPEVLAGDFIGELLKFIVYLAVIVCAFVLGSKLRKYVDARKTAKLAEEGSAEASATDVTD